MPAQKSTSIKDNLYAVRYFISGQGLSLAVFKATRSDLIGPKTKHVDYLTTITHEPNVSIPKLIKYLSDRAHQLEWTVVFKSLIVIHHILNRGNQRFIQNLASSTGNDKLFAQINSFNDVSSKLSLDMSTYLRRYARYLDSRIKAYRTLGVDFCRLKSDSARLPTKMKEMGYDELMFTIPSLQNQFDLVLKFDITMAELDNGIIDQAFLMLYGDLVKLYIAYQAAIIRVIELFLSTKNLAQARELYDVYSLFLVRMDMVQDFMLVVESTGIKTDDFPRVSRVPNITLETFKEKLQQLERGKPAASLKINVSSINSSKDKIDHQQSQEINFNRASSSRITIPGIGKNRQQQSATCKTTLTTSPNKNNNKIKLCDKLIRSSEFTTSRQRAGRRNRASIEDGTTSTYAAKEDSKTIAQQMNQIGGIQLEKYINQELNSSSSKQSKKSSGQSQPKIDDLLGDTSQSLVVNTSESWVFGDNIQPSDQTIEHLFNSSTTTSNKQSDFDLMVIDSELSTDSSDTSHLEDASPYIQLDEKELLEQVFPSEPEKLTILTEKKPNSSARDNMTIDINKYSNNSRCLNKSNAHEDDSNTTSDWVHIEL